MKTFTPKQIELMVNIIDTSEKYPGSYYGMWLRARDKAIFLTMRILALRPKEACGLKFDDFDVISKTIKIRGENNKQGRDRVLPLPDKLIEVYMELSMFPRERYWKGSPYLFTSLHHNSFISASSWEATFREKILKPLGIWEAPEGKSTSPPYSSYSLRHTRATEILNKTKNIFLVADILGHSDITSTEVYIHLSVEYLEYMRKAMSVNHPLFSEEDHTTFEILSSGGARIIPNKNNKETEFEIMTEALSR